MSNYWRDEKEIADSAEWGFLSAFGHLQEPRIRQALLHHDAARERLYATVRQLIPWINQLDEDANAK